jgi:hypothetical protein
MARRREVAELEIREVLKGAPRASFFAALRRSAVRLPFAPLRKPRGDVRRETGGFASGSALARACG